MFLGIEASTMAPIENLTNETKREMKPKRNVDAKQKMNEYIGDESLTLSDFETPMMKNLKHTYVSET